MLEYHSISALVQAAQDSGSTISALVLADQAAQAEAAPEDLYRRMQDNLHVMQEAVQAGAGPDIKSTSGLTGGDAYKMQQYAQGGGLCGPFFTGALTRALAVSEYNAAMGKIVAAPTAGSCGILPGTILTLMDARGLPEDTAVMALFTARDVRARLRNRHQEPARPGLRPHCRPGRGALHQAQRGRRGLRVRCGRNGACRHPERHPGR